MLVRQLEEEVVKTRQHAKETNPEIKAHIEALQIENDHLTREVAILKETIKVRRASLASLEGLCGFHSSREAACIDTHSATVAKCKPPRWDCPALPSPPPSTAT